jgi:hypothetical protein
MRTNPRPLHPAAERPADPNSEPVPPADTRERGDESPIGQDDDLIGAERLPRKGDDDNQ